MSLHTKYSWPATVPLFLPEGSSNSTPHRGEFFFCNKKCAGRELEIRISGKQQKAFAAASMFAKCSRMYHSRVTAMLHTQRSLLFHTFGGWEKKGGTATFFLCSCQHCDVSEHRSETNVVISVKAEGSCAHPFHDHPASLLSFKLGTVHVASRVGSGTSFSSLATLRATLNLAKRAKSVFLVRLLCLRWQCSLTVAEAEIYRYTTAVRRGEEKQSSILFFLQASKKRLRTHRVSGTSTATGEQKRTYDIYVQYELR